MAGIIGGSTFGVAKHVRLHAVKVLDCGGSGSYSQVIEGVDWVSANALHPAVANMSLGGGFYQPLNDAVAASIASGITYAVAAGNSDLNACNYSPASTPTAITVGSVGNASNLNAPISNSRSSFSNTGACLDIFAPGAFIRSACAVAGQFGGECAGPANRAVVTLSGTSMATPHVAGVAALILQKVPGATPLGVRNLIVTYATPGVPFRGAGSPNRQLFAGGIPALSSNAAPEPIRCPAGVTVSGALSLGGQPLAGKIVRVFFNPDGSAPTVAKGTAVTSATGRYAKAESQSVDGIWFAKFDGSALAGAKQSAADHVDCVNR